MVPDAVFQFIRGGEGPEVLDDMRRRIKAWLTDDAERPLPLHRHLGLGGPQAARLALRDHYLTEAAALLEGPSTWQRCRQLAEAARAFEVRRWPIWRRFDSPPTHAGPVDAMLWHARHLGGELPATPENYLNILR